MATVSLEELLEFAASREVRVRKLEIDLGRANETISDLRRDMETARGVIRQLRDEATAKTATAAAPRAPKKAKAE